jgi:hypothetical protein
LVEEDQDMVTVPVGSWPSIAVAVEVVDVDGVAELVPDAVGVGDAVFLLEHAHRLALARTRIVRTATLRICLLPPRLRQTEPRQTGGPSPLSPRSPTAEHQ